MSRTPIPILVACLLLTIACSIAQARTLYGISNGYGNPANTLIYQIDPANGDLSNMVPVTMPGFTVNRALSLTARSSDNSLWAVVQIGPSSTADRVLATINPVTGIATPIGPLADAVATIAFRADGTLYGVVGDGGIARETLFRISTANASMTLAFALGNGADGETIAFHPNGLMYHSSGNGSAMFESVDVDSQVVTPIGVGSGEVFAMGYSPSLGQMFISDISSSLYTVDLATGARTLVGEMSDQLTNADNRGIAFVEPIAAPLYGISNGFGTPENTNIYQIDPANGDLSNIVPVTIPGVAVGRALALAARPSDGSLWAVVQAVGAPNSERMLVTVNPVTGVANPVGVLGDAVATLAFRADGTLFGVVGDGGTARETLFRISTSNAAMTLAFPLGNGADGETIAFHPNGLLYHSSGNGTAFFESVNVDTQVVTPIGTASGEAFAMGYSPALHQMFISDIGSRLYTVDLATGARTPVGDMSDQLAGADNRGLAFVGPINDSCADAIPVADGQTVFGHTTYATNDGSADCAASQTSPDVWYSFVPDCSAFYAVSTSGAATNYDTAVSVHTGCPGTVENLVGCDDDSGGDLTSFAVFQGEAGQTYYIRVNGYNNLTGNFQMAVTGLPNDSCQRPIQVFDGTVGFSNRGATTDGSPSGLCTDVSGEQQILADVWFYYFGTCDGQVEVSTCGPIGYDSKLAVYAYEGEICPAGNPLGCNDDACGVFGLSSRVTFQGTVGGIYIIRVGGYFGSNGCGVLNVACTPDNSCPVCAADYNQDGGVDGGDVAAFFLDWENGLPCADVNLDGGIDGGDVSFFYAFWEQGNCDS